MSCVEKAIIDSREHRETASNCMQSHRYTISNLPNVLSLGAAQRKSIQVRLVPSMLLSTVAKCQAKLQRPGGSAGHER